MQSAHSPHLWIAFVFAFVFTDILCWHPLVVQSLSETRESGGGLDLFSTSSSAGQRPSTGEVHNDIGLPLVVLRIV